MDIAPRTFNALRNTLDKIERRVNELTEAVYEHSHAIDRQKESQEHEGHIVRHIVSLDQETIRQLTSYDERQYRTQKSIKTAAWLAFIAASFYALVAVYQGHQMKRATDAATSAADTARNALDVGQRAFILSGFTQSNNPDFWKISVQWDNDGMTPTRNMIEHISTGPMRTTPLPSDFTFPDVWQKGQAHIPTRIIVSAKAKYTAAEINIPQSLIPITSYYYVWGWARYHDIFPRTEEHITRFCSEFTTGLLRKDAINVQAVRTDPCTRYNCVDKSCKQ
jgi:hypothetical protein